MNVVSSLKYISALAKINETQKINHATFRQPLRQSAISMLSLKKTPLITMCILRLGKQTNGS